jgi:hypothetical protein
MPELKSVIAGLAISTLLTGGVVGMGATIGTTSAGAATQVSTGTSILTDDDFDDEGFGDEGFRDEGFGDTVDFGDSGNRRNRDEGFGFGGFSRGFGGHRCHRGGGGGRHGNRSDFCVNITNDNFNDTRSDRRDIRRDDRRDHERRNFRKHDRFRHFAPIR